MSGTFLEIALASGFKTLVQKLLASAVESADSNIKELFSGLQIDVEPHLKATFERCSKIKTILNKDSPVDLLSLYVNTNFISKNKEIQDYDLIEEINNIRRIIITGTGGGGKTVFMKYLWLSVFVNPRGKIPVFVELRRLNEISTIDVASFIYRSIVDVKSKISQSQFSSALNKGSFLLILDGYDEINVEYREAVGAQIRALADNNPAATIIVSGRPDEQLRAWQAFTNFRVKPLSKGQAIDLIEKLDYDRKIKKKFIERVKKDLFDSHPTFLSIPLLATMMLLTFDQFAEIPEKAYIFYGQAFDTLFLKHDANKDGYQRKKHTDVPIDDFKKELSFFCLFSYFDQKFEFSETNILSYIDKATKASGLRINKEKFLRDLIESVCIMQRNGTEIDFTHRSFQEFFAAYCLAEFIEDQFGEILEHFVPRINDAVISMLFEMRQARVEQEFIIPNLERIMGVCHRIRSDENLEEHLKFFEYKLLVDRNRGKKFKDFPVAEIIPTNGNQDKDFIRTVRGLYKDEFADIERNFQNYLDKDKSELDRLLQGKNIEGKNIFILALEDAYSIQDNEVIISLADFTKSGFHEYCWSEIDILSRLLSAITERNKRQAKTIDSILGFRRKSGR